MAGKFHVNKETGAYGECRATNKPCPLGDNGVHFDNIEDAMIYSTQNLEGKFGVGGFGPEERTLREPTAKEVAEYNRKQKQKPTTATDTSLTENEARVLGDFQSNIKKFIAARAQNNDLALQDAHTQEWAQKKFYGAVDYATQQENKHLLKKLKDARIVDSGSFKMEDGSTVSTDTIIEQKSKLEDITDKQNALKEEMRGIIARAHENGEDLSQLKFKPAPYSEDGKKRVTMSISPDINRKVYDELPESVKKEISTETTSYSVERAREVLSAAKIHKITNRVQTINYFMGKPKDIEGNTVSVPKESTGTTSERLESRQKDIANLHKSFMDANGVTKKEMEAQHEEATEAAKQAATATQSQGSVFLPARSAKNGALISNSYIIDRNEAEARLTEAERKKISTTTVSLSITKAKEAVKAGRLSSEQFDQIFSNYKMNLRVYS